MQMNESLEPQDNVYRLTEKIQTLNPMHGKGLEKSLKNLTDSERETLNIYISFCESCGVDIDFLCESYLTIVHDTLAEQIYFQKHKRYRYSTFAEVASDVYFNESYMSRYMYGLALTTFFWANHIEIKRFYERFLPADLGGKYLEVGPGHGFFFMTALTNTAYNEFEGIDISETSVKLTTDIISYYGADSGKQAIIKLQDFLKEDIEPGSVDAFVMGEVLEHVEEPIIFMERIAEITSEDAFIFVTTCCNAPAVDHIYLFDDSEEVVQIFTKAGLKVKESLILPMEGQTLEACEEMKLPVNVAYVLTKE